MSGVFEVKILKRVCGQPGLLQVPGWEGDNNDVENNDDDNNNGDNDDDNDDDNEGEPDLGGGSAGL